MELSLDKKNRTIGITGGIGSGKSMVSQILRTMDFFVYDSDFWAKELVKTDVEIRTQLISAFGTQAYIQGEYNRSYIAKLVFQDPTLLEKLNSIIHPKVKQHFQQWCLEHAESPFVFKESALIYSHNLDKDLMDVWVVTAPKQVRINRVVLRDGVAPEDVEKRMENQMPQEVMEASGGKVLKNDSENALIPQILDILEGYERTGENTIRRS
ncbi:MAG: dephospho-CoA kinase [Sphingobacteriales bacterium]|jgi:dephospho-CoA kinase